MQEIFNSPEDKKELRQMKKEVQSTKFLKNFDWLNCLINYTYHIRNNYFHGQYRNPNILIQKNDISREGKKLADVINSLNWVLLENNYNLLLGSV